MDLKQIGNHSTGVFDASQYAFFGNDVVEEVELGGLEDDEEEELPVAGIEEDFAFHKEEVHVSRTLSDADDLASTFSKLNRDPEGYRSTVPIAGNGSRQNYVGDRWNHGEELPNWYGQQKLDSEAIQDDKRRPSQPFPTPNLVEQRNLHRATSYPELQHQQRPYQHQQQFSSEPVLVPDQHLGQQTTQFHSDGSHIGSPNLSPFPSSHPQLVGMHHGSPQITGNMPQFRPSLPVNNRPPAQWMNGPNMFPGDNSGIMNNMLPQQQLPHKNGLMPQQQRMPQMQVPQNRLVHPMQPHGHLSGMQPQLFNSNLSRSASSGSYDAMLGFGDLREARPGSSQGNRQNMRFLQQGFDGGLQRRNNAWPPFRSKHMTAVEIENILRMQLVATHSNDPYVDDYYHQARLAKKSAGAKLKHHFCPNHLRDLPSRARTNNEPHAFLQVDALGRVPFSSIRRPRPLLEMDPPNSTKSGNLEQKDTDKPLEQEPMLAARVIIEEGLYLFLEVDDIDRFLEFNQLQDGGNQLRQKRQALLDGLAVSLQLVDPLGKNGQNSGLEFQDLVFLRITSLRKGRKLLTRYLQLLFPGSDPMRIVCMAIFRHLRSLFGARSSDTETTKTTIKLAKVVTLCIQTMDLGPVSLCLAAVSCSSEQPPLRPLGSPVGDEATIILKSALDRATELLRANNYNNSGMNLWRASFDEFFNLLMKHCISKYDSIMQNLNSQLPPHFATEMSEAAAQAIVREMPIELLRASFPHISDEQKRILVEFLKLGSQKTESVLA
ncbi:hypothetical protein ISN45_Aa01g008880 [Arabidopsis thaliana x Arabidopsis arenosa]|uniref:Uncharacterized protein n=1 Tax=Arabidopsis thaliana x Arabidopsis arenosa TaxID=1240361 RepID=A0A8T2BZ39_9BRAS|nr:hypothetical protein ISN45_Aa01g008880 [Arabidopsis thaliana x Arabidopsis arenosa]